MKSFLMIGQSNMAGRGDFGEVPNIINNKTFMLRNGRWQAMSEPVNPDRSTNPIDLSGVHSGISLAASFADEYAKHFNEDIGLIPCADGGTKIDQWAVGELLYDHAVMQAKLAMRTSEFSGILWHQGESDSYSLENATSYCDKLIKIITSIKSELNLPDVPVILGEIGEFLITTGSDNYKYSNDINNAIHKVALNLPNCSVASSKGLTSKSDNLHFNSKSCREMGIRYFNEYIKIVK